MIKNNVIIKVIGYLLGGWAFYYIFITIQESGLSWEQVNILIKGYDCLLLMLVVLLYVTVMYIGAFIWAVIINSLSNDRYSLNLCEIILIHARSNIGKYIPGNFMQFVGRNILGHKLGYSHSNLIVSSALEILVSVLVGMSFVILILMLGLTTIRVSVFDYSAGMNLNYSIFLIVLLLILLFFAKEKIKPLLRRIKSVFQNKIAITQVVFGFIVAYLILGFCNLIIYMVLDNEIKQIDFYNFLVVYVFSWLLGYIVPGPPGGLGVREVIYISLLSMVYDVSMVTLVAIILRVINMLGDLIYLITAETMQRIVNK